MRAALILEVEERLRTRSHEFKKQHLANVIWGAARLRLVAALAPARLRPTCARHAASESPRARARALRPARRAGAAEGARARQVRPDLFQAVEREVVSPEGPGDAAGLAADLTPQQVCTSFTPASHQLNTSFTPGIAPQHLARAARRTSQRVARAARR